MKPAVVMKLFDDHLARQGLALDAVVIGRTALALLGVVSRETRDCDVLHPSLPDEIVAAAHAFAGEARALGIVLRDDWLNNGPQSLSGLRPPGWHLRVQVAFRGKALKLDALGRQDLLKTKLFALCDRGIDIGDCLALKPSPAELEDAQPWVEYQDLNPDWPAHVRHTLEDLGRRISHGL